MGGGIWKSSSSSASQLTAAMKGLAVVLVWGVEVEVAGGHGFAGIW